MAIDVIVTGVEAMFDDFLDLVISRNLYQVFKCIYVLKDFNTILASDFLDAIANLSEVCSGWCFKNKTSRLAIRHDRVTACTKQS